MNRLPRHENILKLIRANGFMPIEELARRLDVTPQTIRRDINQLSEENLLRRCHGGAALGRLKPFRSDLNSIQVLCRACFG